MIKNTNQRDPHNGEGPFVSRVKGDVEAYVPNGCVTSGEPMEGEPTGALPSWLTYAPPEPWNGNRSGE